MFWIGLRNLSSWNILLCNDSPEPKQHFVNFYLARFCLYSRDSICSNRFRFDWNRIVQNPRKNVRMGKNLNQLKISMKCWSSEALLNSWRFSRKNNLKRNCGNWIFNFNSLICHLDARKIFANLNNEPETCAE